MGAGRHAGQGVGGVVLALHDTIDQPYTLGIFCIQEALILAPCGLRVSQALLRGVCNEPYHSLLCSACPVEEGLSYLGLWRSCPEERLLPELESRDPRADLCALSQGSWPGSALNRPGVNMTGSDQPPANQPPDFLTNMQVRQARSYGPFAGGPLRS